MDGTIYVTILLLLFNVFVFQEHLKTLIHKCTQKVMQKLARPTGSYHCNLLRHFSGADQVHLGEIIYFVVQALNLA